MRNVYAHLMRYVLMNLLKKPSGPNHQQVNLLAPMIQNIRKLPLKKKVILRNRWTHLTSHQLIGLSLTIWTTSTILLYSIHIGTDASLAELYMELYINATLKPLDAFIFKYRKQDTSTAEEKVPAEYHEYLDVFKEEVEWFPDSRPWDYAIEMKPRFEPKVFKLYNLTLEKCKQQELFIKENLKKGYIWLSRSPTSGKTLLALTWLSWLSCLKWYFRQLKDNLRQLRHLSQVKARSVFPDEWLPLSSLSIRKMGNYDWHRIINTSINGQSRTPIHYHSFQKSWTRSRPLEPNISPSSMFDEDSTIYTSKMATNGKQHSRPTLDYMNQPSCSLDYAAPLWHSKQWWITLSKMKLNRDFA